jgi:hypothetical protein
MKTPPTVEDIQRAISALPEDELTRLREWFEDIDAQAWDRQLEEDIRAGKLDLFMLYRLDDAHIGGFPGRIEGCQL